MTGSVVQISNSPLSLAKLMLAIGNFHPDWLVYHAVQVSDEESPAEDWLEQNAEYAVLAVWSSDTPAGRARREGLHEFWPSLATALSALQEKYS
jgi:hypothetical protein